MPQPHSELIGQFVKPSIAAQYYNRDVQTLRLWAKKGLIEWVLSPSDQRMYKLVPLEEFNRTSESKENVSSSVEGV